MLKKTSKIKKLIIPGTIATIIVFIIINLNVENSNVYEVTVDKVRKGDMTQVVSGHGKISPVKEVDISAYVGAEIKKILVKEGDSVKKEQLLVELDKTKYVAILERVESDLKIAESRLKIETLQFERAKELFDETLISASDFEAAVLKKELAENQLTQARSAVKQAKDDLEKTSLKAPMDGIVIMLNKEEGEMAVSSQFQTDTIMTIGDLSQMEVRIDIDESDINLIRNNNIARIEVDALPEQYFKGQVMEIAYAATNKSEGTQEETTVFRVKILITEGDITNLLPLMTATVDIETQTRENILYVPIQSITTRESRGADSNSLEQVVFIKENRHVKQIKVETGIMDDKNVEIISGLTEGETVVTGNFRTLFKLLKDGSKVKVID
ncbi:MAG: efflux RND transporter periplasmic adaptor subunit [Spirochaetales bacterium]|nr:efflux RND transporter periplasmic adaptor subunit [Spirochaetales bacterium]